MSKESNPYTDIIDLHHHVSRHHPQMPMEKRAAQFSPFAAMVGHDAAIRETARLTEEQMELTDDEKAIIDWKLQMIQAHIKEQPEVTATYFQPDKKKSGGAYVNVTGSVTGIDEAKGLLKIGKKLTIPISEIVCIEEIVSLEMPHY